MPKIAPALGALQVSRIKAVGMHAIGDPPGLLLKVTPTGTRSWILRARIGSKRRDLGLGSLGAVTLAEAREAARRARAQILEGHDPVEQRRAARAALIAQQAKAMTFEQAADAFIAASRAGWKNPKHAQQWQNTLNMYVHPIIGALDVALIDTGLVLKVLQQSTADGPLWLARTETASRLRGRVEKILDWAAFRGMRSGDNPARWKGHLSNELPARGKVARVEHHPALPYAEVASFMAELRQREGMAAWALEFSILTAARSGEVRLATWDEIDLDARQWTIPGERMKAGKEHRVALSGAAITLLQQIPRMAGNDLVFPAARGGPLSDMSMTALLRRIRPGITQHGFRSTFRDWAGETTSFPREVIEHALAHRLKDKAEAAYQRGDLFDKRRALMAAWADYCETRESRPAKPEVFN